MGGGIALAGLGYAFNYWMNEENKDASQDLYEQQVADQYRADRAQAVADLEIARGQAADIISASSLEGSKIYEGAKIDAKSAYDAALASYETMVESASISYGEALGNVGLMEEEATEALRRMGLSQEQTEASTKAKAGASGVRMSGSTEQYMQEQAAEHQTQYQEAESGYQSQIDLARGTATDEYRANLKAAGQVRKAGRQEYEDIYTLAGINIDTLREKAKLEASALITAAQKRLEAVDTAYLGSEETRRKAADDFGMGDLLGDSGSTTRTEEIPYPDVYWF